eukprot:TRINITY_DN5610_c0_g1_i1.p1 TRINITY_DN5610_c0_g1~~TRINITY_DN5610_c0_g1_i1.p1  ORF type:complete len:485 (-),score=100.43 TRINITY_DN5610_c0_g1_i1:71-1480(-)
MEQPATPTGCSSTSQEVPWSEEKSPLTTRQRAKTTPAAIGSYIPPRGKRLKLGDIAEQRVMKNGVRFLCDRIVPEGCKLPPLPRRPDGSSKLLARSFFERLLSSQIDLQTSLGPDIAAAQPDLRHLAMEHLLSIRQRTLDFSTGSKSHEAHQSFLMKLEKHLYEQIAKQQMEQSEANAVRSEHLQQLGEMVVLAEGARAILAGEAADAPVGFEKPIGGGYAAAAEPSAKGTGSEGTVPPHCWVIPLPFNQWPQFSAAVLQLGSSFAEDCGGSSPAASNAETSTTASTSTVQAATPETDTPAVSYTAPAATTDLSKPISVPTSSSTTEHTICVAVTSSTTSPASQASAPSHVRLRLLARECTTDEAEALLQAGNSELRSVGVLWDRSCGHGRDRRLHWEVAVLSGEQSTAAEVLAELEAAQRGCAAASAGRGGSAGSSSPLGMELAQALKGRSKSYGASVIVGANQAGTL